MIKVIKKLFLFQISIFCIFSSIALSQTIKNEDFKIIKANPTWHDGQLYGTDIEAIQPLKQTNLEQNYFLEKVVKYLEKMIELPTITKEERKNRIEHLNLITNNEKKEKEIDGFCFGLSAYWAYAKNLSDLTTDEISLDSSNFFNTIYIKILNLKDADFESEDPDVNPTRPGKFHKEVEHFLSTLIYFQKYRMLHLFFESTIPGSKKKTYFLTDDEENNQQRQLMQYDVFNSLKDSLGRKFEERFNDMRYFELDKTQFKEKLKNQLVKNRTLFIAFRGEKEAHVMSIFIDKKGYHMYDSNETRGEIIVKKTEDAITYLWYRMCFTGKPINPYAYQETFKVHILSYEVVEPKTLDNIGYTSIMDPMIQHEIRRQNANLLDFSIIKKDLNFLTKIVDFCIKNNIPCRDTVRMTAAYTSDGSYNSRRLMLQTMKAEELDQINRFKGETWQEYLISIQNIKSIQLNKKPLNDHGCVLLLKNVFINKQPSPEQKNHFSIFCDIKSSIEFALKNRKYAPILGLVSSDVLGRGNISSAPKLPMTLESLEIDDSIIRQYGGVSNFFDNLYRDLIPISDQVYLNHAIRFVEEDRKSWENRINDYKKFQKTINDFEALYNSLRGN